jgi:hypothetical protein
MSRQHSGAAGRDLGRHCLGGRLLRAARPIGRASILNSPVASIGSGRHCSSAFRGWKVPDAKLPSDACGALSCLFTILRWLPHLLPAPDCEQSPGRSPSGTCLQVGMRDAPATATRSWWTGAGMGAASRRLQPGWGLRLGPGGLAAPAAPAPQPPGCLLSRSCHPHCFAGYRAEGTV